MVSKLLYMYSKVEFTCLNLVKKRENRTTTIQEDIRI